MTDRLCQHFDYGEDYPFIDRIGLGVAALQYIGMGYAVLPLVRGGKKPHRMLPFDMGRGGDNGVKHATRSSGQVRDWWTLDKAANVGVATGSRSGLVVVDLDVKHGQDGPGSMIAFLEEHGLPWPPLDQVHARTPSGGWHIWLRWPEGMAVPERPGILPGVDIKGDGGLVVAPPSMKLAQPISRPGEQGGEPVPVPYEWSQGCPCSAPMAPAWMGPWLAHAVAAGQPQPGGAADGDVPDADELAETGIPEGQRNSTLYRLACSLYRRYGVTGLGPGLVFERLEKVADKSGLPRRELLVIAESARRFIERQEAADDELIRSSAGWLNR